MGRAVRYRRSDLDNFIERRLVRWKSGKKKFLENFSFPSPTPPFFFEDRKMNIEHSKRIPISEILSKLNLLPENPGKKGASLPIPLA
ncbi:hypothetical protein PEC18_04830 [Paucibacter sp. O1-1]|nr:hypothetical protein [Paucibacter sp. O1-1]MDA3825196.1 hypothetical protein [Paucibacter sp. O1-1]